MGAKKALSALFSKEENLKDKELVKRQLEELREKIKDPEVAKKVALILSLWK
jgi:hypothetical protein